MVFGIGCVLGLCGCDDDSGASADKVECKDGVAKYLESAASKNPSLKDTARKDIEFEGFDI